jgi:hypothetical protein
MDRRFLRDARWLTADRVEAVARVLLVVECGLVASIPWSLPAMQVGRDFAAFWTAGRLALQGRAADAYGAPAQAALAALFGPGGYPPFFYPPTALLIFWPFALLGFAGAVALWVAISGAAYAVAVRALLANRSWLPALAFPAVPITVLYGQNSLFSAALFAAAALTLRARPVLAGMAIGCLAFKPQLAALAPFALAAGGRWRAFVAAAATVAVLVAASALAFGVESWAAFVAALPQANDWNAGGRPGFDRFASVYAAARMLGAPGGVALGVQAIAGLGALSLLVALARRRPGGAAEMAALVAMSAFSVPFLGLYELVIFVVPAAWLVAEAARAGWLPYERVLLAVLFASPLAILPFAVHGVPLAPAALAVLAALVARRIVRPGPLPLDRHTNPACGIPKNPSDSVIHQSNFMACSSSSARSCVMARKHSAA